MSTPRTEILHLTTDGGVGGAEVLLESLAKVWGKGCLSICTLREEGPLHRRLREVGIPCYSLGIRSIRDLPSARKRIEMVLREVRPQILHTHLPHAGLLGVLLQRRHPSLPVVHTRHYADVYRIDRRPFIRQFDRMIMQRMPMIIAVSKSIERLLVETWNIPRHRVQCIHNGIDLKNLRDRGEAPLPDPLRALVEANPGPRIGVIGGLNTFKGQDVFIRAAYRLVGKGSRASFFIMGDGPQRGRLETLLEQLHLQQRVLLTGFVENTPAALRKLDILVVPSRSEGFGLVACEAMALGVPVIASRVDGLPEIVEHGRSGLLFQPGSAEDLAEQIDRLLGDHEYADRLCQEARVRVERLFTIDRMANALDSLYRRLL